jgi:hypothetical protein
MTIKDALNKFGEDYVTELVQRLIRDDKKASGNLIRSIDYEVLEVVTELIDQSAKWVVKSYSGVKINAADYLINVDQGRKKGAKMPPPSALIPWIKNRNIKFRDKKGRFITNKQTSFIIARGISKNGIKPTNVIEETNAAMLNKLNGLSEAYGDELLKGLMEVLKNIK